MGVRRYLCKNDLFYLLRYELSTKYAKSLATGQTLLDHDFIFDRCREVQASPDGNLDLWARYHFKTTIITFGLTIQIILNNPNRTIVILSQNNKEATDKLLQIKRELETNHDFIELFDDIFEHDVRKYERWSEEKGLIVKRRSNPKECTLESYGLVDGQPTGKHFTDRVYDDIVVPDSVRSDISNRNTTEAWEMSLNLGMHGGVSRYAGTRYHFNDTYSVIMDRGAAAVRRYPCYRPDKNGDPTGEPYLYPREYLEGERRSMGPYTFACQMLLDPVAESQQGFSPKWARYYTRTPREERNGRITYLIVDPASEEKKTADYTAMVVLGLGADRKIRLLDGVLDRINLTKRWNKLYQLHNYWRPRFVVYEKLGKDPEVEYMREQMMRNGYVFDIIEVGGKSKKQTRINRLIAPFENGDIILPRTLHYFSEFDMRTVDVVQQLVNVEMRGYPLSDNDHLLDAMSRLYDPDVPLMFPQGDFDPMTGELRRKKDPYGPLAEDYYHGATWQSI
jgi:phage terminase large subunit-like protein